MVKPAPKADNTRLTEHRIVVVSAGTDQACIGRIDGAWRLELIWSGGQLVA